MNKTNVKSPLCHPNQLYKFWLNKHTNQKYKCTKCKRQFVPDSVNNKAKLNSPRYPKCGKQHIYTINISTIIATNVVIRSVIT